MSQIKVVELHPTNFRQISETLRNIADDLEKGEYGEVKSIAIVMQKSSGQICDVFGLGEGEYNDTVALLFSGAQYVANILTKDR